MLAAFANGRAIDGWQLFQQLQTQKASNFLPQADSAVDQLGEEFKQWVTGTFPALAGTPDELRSELKKAGGKAEVQEMKPGETKQF